MSIPVAWRSLLIEHMNGGVPIQRHDMEHTRRMAMVALLSRKWIREGLLGSSERRARHTYLTEAGRFALAKALGDWADTLTRREEKLHDALLDKKPATAE